MTQHYLLYDQDNDVWLLAGPEAPGTRVLVDYDGEPLGGTRLEDIGTMEPNRVVPVSDKTAAAIEMYARHTWSTRCGVRRGYADPRSDETTNRAEEWRQVVKELLRRMEDSA